MKLELTEYEIQQVIYKWSVMPGGKRVLIDLVVEKLNTKLPQYPSWVSVKDRMPTKADSMQGWVVWADKTGGICFNSYNHAFSSGFTPAAWYPLTEYIPPVPTPEEVSQQEFEDFIHSYGRPLEPGEINWAKAGWQAARAKGGPAS